MGFSSNFKVVEQNRRLQTKTRMKYRDMLSSMKYSNPQVYNEDFSKNISKQQVEKIKKEVRKEIKTEIYKQYLYTGITMFGILIIIKILFF